MAHLSEINNSQKPLIVSKFSAFLPLWVNLLSLPHSLRKQHFQISVPHMHRHFNTSSVWCYVFKSHIHASQIKCLFIANSTQVKVLALLVKMKSVFLRVHQNTKVATTKTHTSQAKVRYKLGIVALRLKKIFNRNTFFKKTVHVKFLQESFVVFYYFSGQRCSRKGLT